MGAYLSRNKIVLVIGLLLLAAGLLVNASGFPVQIFVPQLYCVNILPGGLLLTAWFLASRFPRGRWLIIGLGLLVTLVVLASALMLNVGVATLEAFTTPVQDVGAYEQILTKHDERLVVHFPRHIPDNATHVEFYYLPAFLQGGSYFQLRCKLPTSEVDSVLQQYLPVARQVQDSKGTIIRPAGETSSLPATRFRNEENTDFAPLPEDFLVLIFDTEPYSPSDWNHGDSHGIAVSTQRQEVIYWVEYW